MGTVLLNPYNFFIEWRKYGEKIACVKHKYKKRYFFKSMQLVGMQIQDLNNMGSAFKVFSIKLIIILRLYGYAYYFL